MQGKRKLCKCHTRISFFFFYNFAFLLWNKENYFECTSVLLDILIKFRNALNGNFSGMNIHSHKFYGRKAITCELYKWVMQKSKWKRKSRHWKIYLKRKEQKKDCKLLRRKVLRESNSASGFSSIPMLTYGEISPHDNSLYNLINKIIILVSGNSVLVKDVRFSKFVLHNFIFK